MKIKIICLLIIAITLSSACNNKNRNKKEREAFQIPQIDGKWWQITNTYPDIKPYKFGLGDNKVCDFTVFHTSNNTWQCIACVRGNNYPGNNRFLYRWQTKHLTDTLWKEKGFFQTSGTKDKPDAFGLLLDSSIYTTEGKLQAPHCVLDSNKYYLFYNNNGAYCKSSGDGLNWTDLKNDEGNYVFLNMGRDIMLFDDRKNSSNWIAYYTSGDKFPQYMAARTCTSLTGKWSEEKMIYDGWSNTRYPIYRNEFAESPFVIRYKDKYYLFAQMHVFISDDPMDFTANKKIADLETGNYDERVWAPEIIIDKDQYYIAAYRPTGLWMAKLKFIEKKL